MRAFSTRVMLTIFALLGFSGSVVGQSQYEQEWQKRKDYWLSQFIRLNCKNSEMKNAPLGNCDTVTESFFAEFPAILKAVCPKGAKSLKCNNALLTTLFARYQLKYRFADWVEAKTMCDAQPQACNFKTWRAAETFEFFLIHTHNKYVHETAMAEKDEIQAQSDVAALERQKAYLNTLQSMQSQSANYVRCNSSVFGNFINVTCH